MKNILLFIIGVLIVVILFNLPKPSNYVDPTDNSICYDCNDYSILNQNYCSHCGRSRKSDEHKRNQLIPDSSFEHHMREDDEIGTQFRFIADFNGDGLDDIAISSVADYWGQNAGDFTLYIQTTNSLYREAGEFYTHPALKFIRIEHCDYYFVSRLWTSSRVDARKGAIGCQEIERDGNLSREDSISYYVNEFGDINERVFKAIFGHPHTVPIRLEYSDSTNELGQAVWVLVDEYIPPKMDEKYHKQAGEINSQN